jgi:hypothetical protein
LKSLVSRDPGLTFADVTLFFLICFAPTEFFGSCKAA